MNARERRRLQIIGNLSNYDMDIDEEELRGSEDSTEEDDDEYERQLAEYERKQSEYDYY